MSLEIPMQEASLEICSTKYFLKDKDGSLIDKSIEDTYERVASAIASVEKTPELRKTWKPKFLKALRDGAIPAGRIMSNAGVGKHKTSVSLINCTVSSTLEDSMDGIFRSLHEAALTLKAGCGIGYEFSTLRPSGAFVHGAGATTNGPLAFMDVYDAMCFTVSSAGGRRGAQMATFDINHKDVISFIKAKRTSGKFRQFNLSLLITEEFMHAVINDKQWQFTWNGVPDGEPIQARDLWHLIMDSNYNYAEPGFLMIDNINKMNNMWFCEHLRATNPCVNGDTMVITQYGEQRIDSLVDTEIDIWNGYCWSTVTPRITARNQPLMEIAFSNGSILKCTPYHKLILKEYENSPREVEVRIEARFAEVGSIVISHEIIEDGNYKLQDNISIVSVRTLDEIAEEVYCFTDLHNNSGVFNGILTSNCGEQPLPPFGSCLLGSINLTKFVRNPFTNKVFFDIESFKETVRVFTRMLDNVVELNGLPLPQQRHEIKHKRRHGMGFFGLGSALTMLTMKYGSKESVKFTEDISRTLAIEGFTAGVELAREKGEAPILQEEFSVESLQEFLDHNTNFPIDSKKKSYTGRQLMLMSHYFDRFRDTAEGLHVIKMIEKYGCRFTNATSIAPTGTTALSYGNNNSNGIEPSFSHSYTRNVIRAGKNAKESIEVCSYEYLAYRHLVNPNVRAIRCPEGETDDGNYLPDYFVDTDSLSPKEHIDIQAAAQKWIDSSISKTINVPTNMPFEEFKDIYTYAHKMGLKGCTTFRFSPENFQGVLVKNEDLKSTTYKFSLEDGSSVELAGNSLVEYMGQTQTASNLFDAVKENYFGRL